MAQNLFQAPAALETNALMTVSVQVSLLPSGALRIDPELDARILGHSAEQIDAARITGLQHTEGRSRLALTVAGRASPLVLRGHGAQLAWIWLQALAEQGSIDAIPALPCARERTLADIAGHLILGSRGFGFAGDEAHLLSGGSLAEWRSFADLTGMATGGARLLLSFRDGAVWSLAGSAAGIQQQLTDGWLHDAARPPARPPAGPSAWSLPAAVRRADTVRFGTLSLEPAGLTLRSADGTAQLLVGRAHPLHLHETAQAPGATASISLEAAGQRLHLHLLSAAPLHALAASVEWHTRADALDVLTKEDLRLLRPRPRYFRIWQIEESSEESDDGDSSALLAEQYALSSFQPAPLSFHIHLRQLQPPPSLPMPVRVEIGNRRGRFFLPALLYVVQPLPDTDLHTWQLRWVDRPVDANRRTTYRLTLTENVEDLKIDGQPAPQVSLRNFSSQGVALLSEEAILPGRRCRFGIRLPSDPALLRDAHIPASALRRSAAQSFLPVAGTVRWSRPDGRRFWIGVQLDAHPWLGHLSALRERELLRRVADVRTGNRRDGISSVETLNNLDPSLPRTR